MHGLVVLGIERDGRVALGDGLVVQAEGGQLRGEVAVKVGPRLWALLDGQAVLNEGGRRRRWCGAEWCGVVWSGSKWCGVV